MVKVRRPSRPRDGTDHDSKPLPSFRGFVYQHAHFSADKKSIEVAVPPRKGSTAVCSRCHLPARGYDQLAERRFEFIPLWGFLVFLLYTMRRVDYRRCGVVVVEEVPWGDGKRTLTKAYMLFQARWARRLSWKETAQAFRTSWEKVFDAVEHVVTWGLEHRTLGLIDGAFSRLRPLAYSYDTRVVTLAHRGSNTATKHNPVDGTRELYQIHRFANIVVHSTLEAFFAVSAHSSRRHCDDRDVSSRLPFSRPDDSCRFKAVHFWHLNIHQHEIERLLIQFR